MLLGARRDPAIGGAVPDVWHAEEVMISSRGVPSEATAAGKDGCSRGSACETTGEARDADPTRPVVTVSGERARATLRLVSTSPGRESGGAGHCCN
jgi:hypothetical protein